jgi:ketosteroid isomerase-like protein
MTDLASSSSLDIRTEISAAYTTWDLAYNQADAKAIASAYVPNAKVLPPTHEVISGSAAIENFFAGLFSREFTDHNLRIIDAGGDDRVVYSTANWSAKGKGADGAPQTAGGLATHIFERQADGSLKLRLHTFN